PNGKIDRKALSALAIYEHNEATFVAPRNPVEQTLVAIWQQVLGVQAQIGIHDNFFALGGDSILSMQIIAHARQAGIGKLTPKQLFQYQTIAQLAAVVEAEGMAGDLAATRAIGTGPTVGPVPLTPIQHWFFEQKLPVPQHFNQAVLLQISARWQF